jgi:glyoxylate carboligase
MKVVEVVDISTSQIGNVVKPDLSIVSEAKTALVALPAEAKKRAYQLVLGENKYAEV